MKNILNKSILFLVLFLLLSMLTFAGNFTWTGSTSSAWSTATNWSPAQVPSTNDTVTIVTGSNNTYLTSNTTVKVFTINSGTVDVRGFKLKVSGNAYFNSGTITSGQLTLNGTSEVYFSGTLIDAVTKVSDRFIYLNGSTFSDSLTIVKTGDQPDNSKGGNTFNGYVSLVDSFTGAMVLSDSFPDTFNSILRVNNVSTGGIYLAHRGDGNQFNGNVTFLGTKIYSNYYGTATYGGNITISCGSGEVYFGYSTGSCSLVSGKTISLSGPDFSSGNLYFRNFTQLDTTTTISLTLLGTSHLYFESGSAFNAPVTCSAPLLYLDGTKFYRTTSLTNTGSSNVTSTGGCYFGGLTTINNNPASSITYSLANTTTDTFATTATIQNSKGIIDFNNGLFNGNVTLKNLDSSDTNVRFYVSNSGATKFEGTLTIDNHGSNMVFGKSGGTTILDSSQVISFVSGFSGNIQLAYFSQRGSTSQSFTFPGSGSELILGSSSSFDGSVTFYGQSIELDGTTFNGTTSITRYGSSGNTCYGGNVFNGTTTILDSSSSSNNFIMANSSADDFNGNATFIQKGTSVNIYPSYTKNSTFAGSIMVDGSSAISFGANGGKAIIDGSSSQSINNSGSFTPSFKKIEVNKSGGALTLNTPLSISDSLILLKGIINSDTTNIVTLANGGIVTSASDSSFVNGPFKKIGNAAFIFPIGYDVSNGFHPLEITAPSSTTDAYTAQYFHIGQSLGSSLDTTIENLSACQYWSLTRNTGTSKVRIKLNWNYDSCGIIDPQYMRIAGWNGSLWKDFSSYAYSGDSLKGSSSSLDSTSTIGVFTLSNKRCIYFRDVLTSQDVTCHGGVDGTATVSVYGGTAPYNYSWSSSMGTKSSTPVLFAGQYTVEISDTFGCHLSDTVFIHQPDTLILSFSTTHFSSCHDSVGIITASATGGVGILKNYLWTYDLSSSQTHADLPAGEYSVLVTDSNGCTIVGTVQLSDTDGPIVSLNYMIPVSCFEGNDGKAKIDVFTYNNPYKIEWSTDVFDTLDTISNKGAGFYSVQVIDSLGCITFDTVEITQPDTFKVSLAITNTRCGAHEGSVTATVYGGTSDYTYSWSIEDAPPESEITNLNSCIGNVNITDAKGCTIVSNFEILDINGINATGYIIADATCAMDSDGSARVVVSGGTEPYLFSWSPSGGDNDTAINLISDYYQVTVIDSNGCRQKANITVNCPPQLESFLITTLPNTDSTSDGKAESIVYGGTIPYTYSWSSGQSTPDISGLGIGDEDTLTVTDNNGCTEMSITRMTSSRINTCFRGNTTPDPALGWPTFPTCPGCTSYSDVNKNIVIDFGADPSGINSSEYAFEAASAYFASLDPMVSKKLTIPWGQYTVGRQDKPWASHGNSVLYFNGINNLEIEGLVTYGIDGYGRIVTFLPRLKFEDCMLYGKFDPSNWTDRYLSGYDRIATPPPCYEVPTNYSKICTPGTMIHINGCINVTVKNLELDGNIDNIVVGGGNSQGIQIPEYAGIFVNASINVTIDNVNAHHFGADGMRIDFDICPWPQDIYPPFKMNMKILNSKFLYNGRTGLVWGGGKGLTVLNCDFSYTGQSRVAFPSYDGVDIEYENSVIPNSNGKFENCRFKYNGYAGLECHAWPWNSASVALRDVTFKHDIFVASENGVTCIPQGRDFLFQNCFFYGHIWEAYYAPVFPYNQYTNIDNTKFEDCYFNEQYTDPDILPLTAKSFNYGFDEVLPNLTPDPLCPMPVHHYLIDFSTACNVEMKGCSTITNFTFLEINISGTSYPPNQISYSHLTSNTFLSYGLNQCACDRDLTALYCTDLRNPNYFYNSVSATGCPTFYHTWWYYTSPPSYFRTSYWGLGYLTNTPLVHRYLDTHHANDVTDYFAYTNSPCPVIETPTYPLSCYHGRLRNPLVFPTLDTTISIHPNPSSNIITIENENLGVSIKICNITGDLIFEKIITSKSYEIDIKNLKPGVYIIKTENGKSYKFIKI